MKQVLLSNFLIVLSFLMVQNINAQVVCEEQGYVVEAASAPTACAGSTTGQATVSSTGCSCMFSGCTYQWSDGQTFHTAFNLTAGTYSVIVTHPPDSLGNICEVTVDVVVEDGEDMIQDVVQTDLTCKDGNDASITVTPSLFAGQLNYQWSTGDTTQTVEGLSAGTYAVTVSNFENCLEQLQFEITEPENVLSIEVVEVKPACGGLANGSVALNVSGAEEYTAIAVDGDDNEFDDISALAAGEYEVIITDENGCSTDTEISIEEGDLEVEISASSLSTCAGNEIQLEAITAQDATFVWSGDGIMDETSAAPMAMPSATTTYTVLVETAEGCSAEKTITIEVEAAPAISFLYNGDLNICEGEFKNMVVSVPGATSYVWEPTTGVTGTNAVYLEPTETTTYTVTASLANGCMASSEFTLTVEDCGNTTTSIGEGITKIDNIFPNPSEGVFQVNAKEMINSYSIYDISGRTIQQGNVNATNLELDLTNETSGIYFLHIATNSGSSIEKLLKQ